MERLQLLACGFRKPNYTRERFQEVGLETATKNDRKRQADDRGSQHSDTNQELRDESSQRRRKWLAARILGCDRQMNSVHDSTTR